MPILARFTNFYDFYDFRKAVATAFLGISKIPTVNVEIHSFSFICSKISVSQCHRFVPRKSFGVFGFGFTQICSFIVAFPCKYTVKPCVRFVIVGKRI